MRIQHPIFLAARSNAAVDLVLFFDACSLGLELSTHLVYILCGRRPRCPLSEMQMELFGASSRSRDLHSISIITKEGVLQHTVMLGQVSTQQGLAYFLW